MLSPAPLVHFVLPSPAAAAPHGLMRIVRDDDGELFVGIVVRTSLADQYDALRAVEPCPARRAALALWAKSAREAGR